MSARLNVWCHLHLPKYRKGDAACVSLTQPGKTVRYTDYVELVGVKFVIHKAERAAALADGRETTHAFVVGRETEDYWAALDLGHDPAVFRYATYDPKLNETFVDYATGEPVLTARAAVIHGKTVLYLP